MTHHPLPHPTHDTSSHGEVFGEVCHKIYRTFCSIFLHSEYNPAYVRLSATILLAEYIGYHFFNPITLYSARFTGVDIG